MGRHHREEDSPEGPDTLFARHSLEEREAETGTMTSVDLQRQLGILPRDTPSRGFPTPPPAPYQREVARVRRSPAPYGGQGRSVDPSPWGRVVAAVVLVGILVIVVLVLRG